MKYWQSSHQTRSLTANGDPFRGQYDIFAFEATRITADFVLFSSSSSLRLVYVHIGNISWADDTDNSIMNNNPLKD